MIILSEAFVKIEALETVFVALSSFLTILVCFSEPLDFIQVTLSLFPPLLPMLVCLAQLLDASFDCCERIIRVHALLLSLWASRIIFAPDILRHSWVQHIILCWLAVPWFT